MPAKYGTPKLPNCPSSGGHETDPLLPEIMQTRLASASETYTLDAVSAAMPVGLFQTPGPPATQAIGQEQFHTVVMMHIRRLFESITYMLNAESKAICGRVL